MYEYYDQVKDPIKIYFREKIQMMYSNKAINDILETQIKTRDDKKSLKISILTPPDPVGEERGPSQSINTHKELRLKKFELENRIKVEDEKDKNSLIKNLMDQHQSINNVIKSHYQKEIMSQEDEFNRKMNERRDRSLERSLVRGSSKKVGFINDRESSKANTGLKEFIKKDLPKKEQNDNPPPNQSFLYESVVK